MGVRTHVNSKRKIPSTGCSKEVEPPMLHHAWQRAKHTTDWTIPSWHYLYLAWASTNTLTGHCSILNFIQISWEFCDRMCIDTFALLHSSDLEGRSRGSKLLSMCRDYWGQSSSQVWEKLVFSFTIWIDPPPSLSTKFHSEFSLQYWLNEIMSKRFTRSTSLNSIPN